MSHARIRSVRLKSGGAEVRVLHTERRQDLDGEPENWNGTIVDNARTIAEDGRIVGYAIVAVYGNGLYHCAYRFDHEAGRMPATLWPSYVAEVLRKEYITRKMIEGS